MTGTSQGSGELTAPTAGRRKGHGDFIIASDALKEWLTTIVDPMRKQSKSQGSFCQIPEHKDDLAVGQ